MSSTKTEDQIAKMWPTLEKDNEGKIKSFSVPDAHDLRVIAFFVNEQTREVEQVKNEVVTLPSIDALESLHFMVDAQDGYNYGAKYMLDAQVIKDLRSKGQAIKIRRPMRFEYILTKTKHADELRHKG